MDSGIHNSKGIQMPEPSKHVSRRQLLSMIGKVAGGSAMYQAMSSLGYAAESSEFVRFNHAKVRQAGQVQFSSSGRGSS